MAKAKKCSIKRHPAHFQVDLKDRYPHDKSGKLERLNSCVQRMINAGRESGRGEPDDATLMYIAGQHSIIQTKFEDMIGEFFYPNQVPEPEPRKLREVQDLIDEAGDGEIVFKYDDWERTSNGMSIKAYHDAKAIYSAYLFRGIILLYPNEIVNFHFYRAIDEGDFTVAIAAVDKDSKVLYLGELAGLFP